MSYVKVVGTPASTTAAPSGGVGIPETATSPTRASTKGGWETSTQSESTRTISSGVFVLRVIWNWTYLRGPGAPKGCPGAVYGRDHPVQCSTSYVTDA